jgi:hypothetical protein
MIEKIEIINNGKKIDKNSGNFPLFPKELKIKFI